MASQNNNIHITTKKLEAIDYYLVDNMISMYYWNIEKDYPGHWKKYQEQIIDPDDLKAKILDSKNNELFPFIITGEVSGGLEVIDIDEKNEKGISAKYLNAIKNIAPEILKKLRIHKTKTDGYHLLYKCPEIPLDDKHRGNSKISSNKVYNHDKEKYEFPSSIETRGEGGLVFIPPMIGYSVIRDVAIPTISYEERNTLLTIARQFDKKEYSEEQTKKKKDNKEIYNIYESSMNPFDQYNASDEARSLLINEGWKELYESGDVTYYRRPGKKKGVSATLIENNGFIGYYIFTTSTNLQSERLYDPSALKCELSFGGDYKTFYRDLVSKGYGRLKESYEDNLVKRAKLSEVKVPENASEATKEKIEELTKYKKEAFPYGTFWEFSYSTTGNLMVTYSRDKLIDVSKKMGIRHWKSMPIKLIGNHLYQNIEKTGEILRLYREYLNKKYWKENDIMDKYDLLFNTHDTHMEKHLKHLILNLPEISNEQILTDTREKAFAVTPNYVKIISSKGEIESIPFSDMDNGTLSDKHKELYDFYIKGKYIDIETIQHHDWEYISKEEREGTKWVDFIDKATSIDVGNVQNILGYMVYSYRSKAEPYFVCFLDEQKAEDGGGTGKGVTADMLRYWTGVYNVSGTTIQNDLSLILQGWNKERIVAIDDLTKYNFLHRFKSMASKGLTWKRLYKDIVELTFEESPKVLMDGQFGMDIFTDGGVKRRAIMIPFSGEVFNGNGGQTVDEHYGGVFPDCWTEKDWNGYYSWMADAIVIYMNNRRIKDINFLTQKGWEKSFDYTYEKYGGEDFRVWVVEHINSWVKISKENGAIAHGDLMEKYSSFQQSLYRIDKFRKAKLYSAIRIILKKYGYGMHIGRDRTTIPGSHNKVSWVKIFKDNQIKNAETLPPSSGWEDDEVPF